MDIDIDVTPNFRPDKTFKNCVIASNVLKEKLVKHNSGVYFQYIPQDPLTNLAAIPYEEAEETGYFKFDFLHLNALTLFESKQQMDDLLEIEPDWSMLEDREVVEKLFQISSKFEIVYAVKPKNVLELADVVALIRPNKQKLLDKYLKNKKQTRKELYTRREAKDMRKAHAIPYALMIVLQLHLVKMGKL